MIKNPRKGSRSARSPNLPDGQPTTSVPSTERGLSFGSACSRKIPYDSEIDALCGAAAAFRHVEKMDWPCMEAYKCPDCGKFHLTKAGMDQK